MIGSVDSTVSMTPFASRTGSSPFIFARATVLVTSTSVETLMPTLGASLGSR